MKDDDYDDLRNAAVLFRDEEEAVKKEGEKAQQRRQADAERQRQYDRDWINARQPIATGMRQFEKETGPILAQFGADLLFIERPQHNKDRVLFDIRKSGDLTVLASLTLRHATGHVFPEASFSVDFSSDGDGVAVAEVTPDWVRKIAKKTMTTWLRTRGRMPIPD